MPEISVAVLEVNKFKADLTRQTRRPGKCGDYPAYLGIRDGITRGSRRELGVQYRVMPDDNGFQARFLVRPAKAAGVRQLEAHQQIISASEARAVGANHFAAQYFE